MAIHVKSLMVVGVVSLLIGGCSGSVDGGGSGGTGGNGTGGNGTGGSAGSGGGAFCGGFVGAICAATEYCDYPDDICGGADGQGVCRPRPEACPENYLPTCACDGMIYGNACNAAGNGFDVSNLGGCMPQEPNQFNCGHIFCDTTTQYCRKTNTDVGGTPDSYVCVDLPAACAGMKPSCACIGDACGAPMVGSCAPSGDGFMATCPGG